MVARKLGLNALLLAGVSYGQVGPTTMFDSEDVGPHSVPVDVKAYARVLYVKVNGDPSSASGTIDHPFNSLQTALSAVDNTHQRTAILIGEGLYHVSRLQLKPNVDLFGGYGDDFTRRDLQQHVATLDARGEGPVLIAADHTQVDGFTITGGRVNGSGGAILCKGASPVIANNIFVGNCALHPETLKPETLHIIGHEGGAIAILDGSSPQITGNLFVNNTTEIGDAGAIMVRGASHPKIARNVFIGNETGLTDTSVYDGKIGSRSSNGAAISISDTCSPEITQNVIARNRSHNTSDAGGIYVEYEAAPHIHRNWLVGNTTGDDGGAIYVRGLADNSPAKGHGPLIENNLFAGNRVFNPGRKFDRFDEAICLSKCGKALVRNNLFTGQGSAVGVSNSILAMESNIVVNNLGEGVYVDLRQEGIPRSTVSGNIFWGNAGKSFATVRTLSAPPALKDNIIQGGYEGEGNRDEDPLFRDDSLRGKVLSLQYDEARFVTRVTLDRTTSAAVLSGRIACVGSQWSVIAGNNAAQITLWGRIDDSSEEFIVAPTYARLNLRQIDGS